MIEEAIRYPGFSFVNIQSPCITYGDADTQMKTQKTKMRKLEAEGHDVTNRIRAMELAADYGKTLYTGVFYRNPNPPPTYGRRSCETPAGDETESPAHGATAVRLVAGAVGCVSEFVGPGVDRAARPPAGPTASARAEAPRHPRSAARPAECDEAAEVTRLGPLLPLVQLNDKCTH